MKQITLESLSARNFKGFREFGFSTNGGNLAVYGDNGVGKTTIADCWNWVLFGKDSTNKTDFEIKELDSNGQVRQHKLEHEVEVVLAINGTKKTLRRVLTEKWTKKRGSITELFDGHKTTYFVDGVPVTATEYDAEIASIIDEGLFKLLTSPSYFNEQLKKEDRRKQLMDICGDVSDVEVIHSNKALSPLERILHERDIEKHKAIVAAQLKKINEQIKDIPVRISEAQRSMPDLPTESERQLHSKASYLREQIKDLHARLAAVDSGGEIARVERELQENANSQMEVKRRVQSDTYDRIAEQRKALDTMLSKRQQMQQEVNNAQYEIDRQTKRVAQIKESQSNLRAKFEQIKEKQFAHNHSDDCPTCGQLLPDDQRQAAHDKALAAFNADKSQQLTSIKQMGQLAKSDMEKHQAEIKNEQELIARTEPELLDLDKRIAAAESELAKLRNSAQDVNSDPEYIQLQKDAAALQHKLTALHGSTQVQRDTVQFDIDAEQKALASVEAQLATFGLIAKQQDRIVELEQQERELAKEYECLQHELHLTEEFVRSKVALLQHRIDGMFKIARFRLFETQINGGIKEVCDTLCNGVPYDGGLNNAARINVGIDIINTLSQHYGVSAPIFVDNAESVVSLIDTDAQLIRLIVSADDKQLRIVEG